MTVLCLLVGVQNQRNLIVALYIVRRHLDTGIGEAVAQPYERYTTGEDTHTTTYDELVLVVLIPTEAYAGAPHRCRVELVIGSVSIAVLGSPRVEWSIL